MDRLPTLLKKLQQQIDDQAPAISMLTTVHQMQAELEFLAKKQPTQDNRKVSVLFPFTTGFSMHQSPDENQENGEEKVVSVLEVDEEEVAQELEEIKEKAKKIHSFEQIAKPAQLFDPIEEVPTLNQQDNKSSTIHEQLQFDYTDSLNDKLKEEKTELSQSLTHSPIKDLKKAIGVNDRFLFINELFRGDEAMYERSIKTIQNFSIYAEAEFWIRRELKIKLGWLDADPVVKQFNELIRRRFS